MRLYRFVKAHVTDAILDPIPLALRRPLFGLPWSKLCEPFQVVFNECSLSVIVARS